MGHLKRRVCRAGIVLLCATGAAMAMTSAAGAAIPRPPGAIDNRGYELVSQADDNGTHVQNGIVVSRDGGRVLYETLAGVPGSTSGQPNLLAERTAGGWKTRNFMPPRDEMLANHYLVLFENAALTSYIAAAYDGIAGPLYGTDEFLARVADDGHQTLIHAFPTFESWAATALPIVGTDDFKHLFGVVQDEQIDPSQPAEAAEIYDFGTTPPTLVSTTPSTGQAAQCGIPNGSSAGFADSNRIIREHFNSVDGKRVFFLTKGDVCSARLNLYVHDTTTGDSTLISGPPISGDTDRGVNWFVGATPDGSQAFYVTGTSLDPVDDTDGRSTDLDVYRYDVGTGTNTCVTCVVGQAYVAGGGRFHTAVSQDGQYVYFQSTKQLLPAATVGAYNIYVVHDGTLSYAGAGTSSTQVSASPRTSGQITPDGKFLFYTSNRPEMDAISGSSNGGFYQYYRYDAVTGNVTCISCPGAGTPTADVPYSEGLVAHNQIVQADVRAMSDDGSKLFFTTSEALVPQDVDGDTDIYEWSNGTVGLITDGVTSNPPGFTPHIFDVSADGRDVFIGDTARLTADAQGGAQKLYDVRIDGGFPVSTPTPACSGEACHGLPSEPPPPSEPASLGFQGAGNVTAAPPARFEVGKVTAAQLRTLARRGTIVLRVRLSRPGRISATARARIGTRVQRLGRVVKSARRAGTLRFRLRLSRAGRAQLRRAGRLNLILDVRYSRARTAKRIVLRLKVPTANRAAHSHGH